jgi:ribokinase
MRTLAPKKIVVLGSSNTDMIVAVDRLPRPGETLLGGTFQTGAGGKGANQAVSVARAGGDVAFVARIGQDAFGQEARAGFVRERIDVRHIIIDKKSPSGVALVFVAKNGENSIAVASGANANLTPADVARARRTIQTASVLLMQLETPLAAIRCAAEIAFAKGIPVILNPAPARALPDALLKKIAILTPNETEAEFLTGIKITDEKKAQKAAEQLLRRGVKTVILTLGAKGVWVATRDFAQHVPGFKVRTVDTTAAGDTFNGALAVACAEGRPILDAIRFANAAAALSTTKAGAQPSAPRRKKIDALARTSPRSI